jgi:hypothetical protein
MSTAHLRPALLAALLLSPSAFAEAGFLTTRGRLLPEARLEVWGGQGNVGLGLVKPDADDARAAWGVELSWALQNRYAEARVGRQWQFSKTRFATGSVTVGGTAIVVPVGAPDLGLGPHVTLNLGLGGRAFTVDLSLMTGAELFTSAASPRLPQRLQLGVNGRIGAFTLAAMARTGIDLEPGKNFIFRGELIFSLGWLGWAGGASTAER